MEAFCMPSPSIADAAKPYLDYLDKEMTIEGILSAFCVAVSAAAFDRVLGVKAASASDLVKALQDLSYPYVLAATIALMTAALCFYLQRSALAWLYGQISLAVTREMQDTPGHTDRTAFTEGLNTGDSWSLWNRYKFGLSFLAVTAGEVLLALFFSITKRNPPLAHWWIALIPFLLAGVAVFVIWYLNLNRDKSVRAPKNVRGTRPRIHES
jgi:lipoprotein signal peptidase